MSKHQKEQEHPPQKQAPHPLQTELDGVKAQIEAQAKLYDPKSYDKLTEEEKLAIGEQETALASLRDALDARIAAAQKK